MTRMNVAQITTNYFCAAVFFGFDGVIIDAAPILKWSIGKSIIYLETWARKNGGTMKLISTCQDHPS